MLYETLRFCCKGPCDVNFHNFLLYGYFYIIISFLAAAIVLLRVLEESFSTKVGIRINYHYIDIASEL